MNTNWHRWIKEKNLNFGIKTKRMITNYISRRSTNDYFCKQKRRQDLSQKGKGILNFPKFLLGNRRSFSDILFKKVILGHWITLIFAIRICMKFLVLRGGLKAILRPLSGLRFCQTPFWRSSRRSTNYCFYIQKELERFA